MTVPMGAEIVYRQSTFPGKDGEVRMPYGVVKLPPHSPILLVMFGDTFVKLYHILNPSPLTK